MLFSRNGRVTANIHINFFFWLSTQWMDQVKFVRDRSYFLKPFLFCSKKYRLFYFCMHGDERNNFSTKLTDFENKWHFILRKILQTLTILNWHRKISHMTSCFWFFSFFITIGHINSISSTFSGRNWKLDIQEESISFNLNRYHNC